MLATTSVVRIGASLEGVGTRSFTIRIDVLDGERLVARSDSVAVVLGDGRAQELTASTRQVLLEVQQATTRAPTAVAPASH